jgi:hypothetical protein
MVMPRWSSLPLSIVSSEKYRVYDREWKLMSSDTKLMGKTFVNVSLFKHLMGRADK